MSTLLLAALIALDADLAGTSRLFDFADASAVEDWFAINDVVMGGVSSGRMIRADERAVAFVGHVSLDNNGGFASVRSRPRRMGIGESDGLLLRVRGDGKRYKINLKTDRSFEGLLYRATFDTEPGRWRTVAILFDAFQPTFRGRIVEDAPELDLNQVVSVGLMISDKQAGPFVLELQWIDAFVK